MKKHIPKQNSPRRLNRAGGSSLGGIFLIWCVILAVAVLAASRKNPPTGAEKGALLKGPGQSTVQADTSALPRIPPTYEIVKVPFAQGGGVILISSQVGGNWERQRKVKAAIQEIVEENEYQIERVHGIYADNGYLVSAELYFLPPR